MIPGNPSNPASKVRIRSIPCCSITARCAAFTRGEAQVAKDNLLGALGNCSVNRKDFIHHVEKCVESRLDVVAAIDGDVAMQNLLRDLRVGDQALAPADQFFRQSLRIGLEWPRRSYEMHLDIGVNQNHGC